VSESIGVKIPIRDIKARETRRLQRPLAINIARPYLPYLPIAQKLGVHVDHSNHKVFQESNCHALFLKESGDMLLASKCKSNHAPSANSANHNAYVRHLEGRPARRSDLWWVYRRRSIMMELTLPIITVFPILHRPFFRLLRCRTQQYGCQSNVRPR